MPSEYRKKLIEVALPLDAVNTACEQDKNRKTGHIRNLHKWFAPMPLPAWRALLLASVLDDPSNNLPPNEAAQERERLFTLVKSIVPLDAASNGSALDAARDAVLTATGGKPPTVVDPFCGGGSTVVEAQRLGFPAIGSDLNPLPVLITTTLCRTPQLFKEQSAVNPEAASGRSIASVGLDALIDDVRYYAGVVQRRAWAELEPYYPVGSSGEQFIAWRWAWAVPSPNPAAGGSLTPLVTDWALSRSKREKVWVTPVVDDYTATFAISRNGECPERTAGGNSARCLFTNDHIPFEYIRSQAQSHKLRPQMIAMVGELGGKRVFVNPTERQIKCGLDDTGIDIPHVELPEKALGFRVQAYGVDRFSDLFLPRQARAVSTFADHVSRIHKQVMEDASRTGLARDDVPLEDGGCGARAYADAVSAVLGLCVGRIASANNVLVQWFIDPRSGGGKATPAFRMQTVSMVWDFVETNPFAKSVGGWCGPVLESALKAFKLVAKNGSPAEVLLSDAREVPSRIPADCLVATDPPYYANIGYADLSDFFYIWLRRALRGAFPNMFSTVASPKINELIAAAYRHGDSDAAANEYFSSGFQDVFESLAERVGGAYPISVIYAVKQQQGKGKGSLTGWEVFLDGLLRAGLSVVATWPIRTTTLTRTRGLKSNALASAICVVCRQRDENKAPVSRREFLVELRMELQHALGELQLANIAPVDLAQAAVGRGMAVFSKYPRVMESDGAPMTVGTALEIINQVLDEVLAEQETEFDSDSRWALSWYEQFGSEQGPYGVAETLSRAKNTAINGLVEAGIIRASGGVVRLVRRDELSSKWDPVTDNRPTVWEMTQHLIRVLEGEGEHAAALLVDKLRGSAEIARDLAYRLYNICERRKLQDEALAYNGLVIAWPELTKLALAERTRSKEKQTEMF